MFEKEAEEYAKQNNPAEYGVRATHFTVLNAYKDGAEFGYNKANEWFDLRKNPNDLPKENMKRVMVITNYNDCLMAWYCIHEKTWYNSDCPDPDDCIETEDIMNVKVIAWKEIVLPQESE